MQIDLAHADPREFFVRQSALDGIGAVVQVSPRGQKHRWRPDELHLRSLLCRPDGAVLSSGFPKFFNLGEDPEHDAQATTAIAAGQAWLTEKMDGSLLIRDVIEGQVHLRTRGAAGLPPDKAPRIHALLTQHPALLDSTCLPDRSVLLEYTSPHPDDRIIVPYDRPQITALGWMQLQGAEHPVFHGSPDDVALLAEQTGAPPVRFLPAPQTMAALIAEVRDWTGREGVVLRYALPGGGLGLLKLKSLRYLRNHTARFHLTRARLWRLCWAEQIQDRAQLAQALHSRGLDWEIVDYFAEDFDAYTERRLAAEATIVPFLAALSAAGVDRAADRAEAVSRLRAVVGQRAAWSRLFPLGINWLKGEPDARLVSIVAMIFEESLGAARHFIAKGLDSARVVTPGLEG
ncbi:MAG: hypothetical protein ACI8S6_004220 [Myxococcota bacterium]|jgi:hypothetical protein